MKLFERLLGPAIIVPLENTEREKLYFLARNMLQKSESINDTISALQTLSKAADMGYTRAVSLLNDIRYSVYKIVSKGFIPEDK